MLKTPEVLRPESVSSCHNLILYDGPRHLVEKPSEAVRTRRLVRRQVAYDGSDFHLSEEHLQGLQVQGWQAQRRHVHPSRSGEVGAKQSDVALMTTWLLVFIRLKAVGLLLTLTNKIFSFT